MDFRNFKHVRPLREAECQYLQALVTSFELARHDQGVTLHVRFDDSTPAIWSGQGKHELAEGIHDFRAKATRYQQELDAFLVDGQGSNYRFDDEGFPFRYASGGTLPIAVLGGREYYCLFYREIAPIGWNIANGGCDSRDELLRPLETIDRELREELIVVDPSRQRRYVFEGQFGLSHDRPEFAKARRIMESMFPSLDLPRLDTEEVRLKWLDGPDQLVVTAGNGEFAVTDRCFLNINAEDFGIEIDRVAWIHLDPTTVLCDGEVFPSDKGGHVSVNAPIGLFEVNRVHELLDTGADEFLPDLFFYSAQCIRSGTSLPAVVDGQFFPHVAGHLPPHRVQQFRDSSRRFGLCPVTRRIIQRFRQTLTAPPSSPVQQPPAGGYDTFISFASEDREHASRVYDHLSPHRSVFFSDKTMHDAQFSRAINDALESATSLVVVGTDLQHILKRWVRYEWQTFHDDILSGHKPETAQLMTFTSGIDPRDLPRPLRYFNSVDFDPGDPSPALARLAL